MKKLKNFILSKISRPPEPSPPVGMVNWGDFRQVKPFSMNWGFDRGLPIDRYYIEQFLSENKKVITGTVLEIGDNTYTQKFGDWENIQSEVLHKTVKGKHITYTTDLMTAEEIPSNRFNCIILTQTLQYIPNPSKAMDTLYRILAPGGTLLATTPGIALIDPYSGRKWQDIWRHTKNSATLLFEEHFPVKDLEIRSVGNVLTTTAFLYGMASNELAQEELEFNDPLIPMLITIKARKI